MSLVCQSNWTMKRIRMCLAVGLWMGLATMPALAQQTPARRAVNLSSGTMNQLLEQYHVDLEILKHKIRMLEEELEDMEFRAKRMVQDQKNLASIKGLRITGRGRGWFNDLRKSGKAVNGLSQIQKHEQDASSYFEFHLTGRPDEKVLAYAEFRAASLWGGQWSTQNTFEFRRIYLGLNYGLESVDGGAKLDMGSITVHNTPFTLHNPLFEPEGSPALLWLLKREALLDDSMLFQSLEIESENQTKVWPDHRLQRSAYQEKLVSEGLIGDWVPMTGIHVRVRKPGEKIDEIFIKFIAARTNAPGGPDHDQWLGLLRADIKPSPSVRFGLQGFWHGDIGGSSGGASLPVIRPMSSMGAGALWEFRFLEQKLGIEGEVVLLRFNGDREGSFVLEDMAASLAFNLKSKSRYGEPLVELELRGSEVGPFYYVFAAQSLAYDPLAADAQGLVNAYTTTNPGFLRKHTFNPTYNSEIFVGEYRAYDRLEDNAQPYGPATPNRRGVELSGRLALADEAIRPFFRGAYHMEIQPNLTFDYFDADGTYGTTFRSVEAIGVDPDGAGPESPSLTISPRTFLTGEAGIRLDIGKLLWDGSLTQTLRGRYQWTGNEPEDSAELSVDMRSLLVQWGLEVPIGRKVTLMASYEYLQAQGQEYFLLAGLTTAASYPTLFGFRNDLNFIYSHVNFFLEKQTLATGLLFQVTNNAEIVGLYSRTEYDLEHALFNGLPADTAPGGSDEDVDEVSMWIRVMF